MRLALLVVEHELNRLDQDEFFDDFKGVQGAKGASPGAPGSEPARERRHQGRTRQLVTVKRPVKSEE